MTEFKNLKMPVHTHEKLVSRAKRLGMKKFALAETVVLMGLAASDDEIQKAVVNAQQEVTPLPANTNPESNKE